MQLHFDDPITYTKHQYILIHTAHPISYTKH